MADIEAILRQMSNENTAKTFAFNSAEAQKSRDYQTQMSNTSHQREVEDLKRAGINPVLSANGGAQSYSASSASGSADNSAVGVLASIYQTKLNNDNAVKLQKMQNENQYRIAQNEMKNAKEIARINQAASNYASNNSYAASRYASDLGYSSSIYGSNTSNKNVRYSTDRSKSGALYNVAEGLFSGKGKSTAHKVGQTAGKLLKYIATGTLKRK